MQSSAPLTACPRVGTCSLPELYHISEHAYIVTISHLFRRFSHYLQNPSPKLRVITLNRTFSALSVFRMPVFISRGDEAYWARRAPVLLVRGRSCIGKKTSHHFRWWLYRLYVFVSKGKEARRASSPLSGGSAGSTNPSKNPFKHPDSVLGPSTAELNNAPYLGTWQALQASATASPSPIILQTRP